MYLEYFGLTEAPFSITPDPAFVYLSARHRDALAHLLYGVGKGGSGGFVQLTGEVGTGKTTLCRCVLEQVPEGTHIALVLNPLMTPTELLAAICEELGIRTAGIENSNKALVDSLNYYLLSAHQAGEQVVVVIDEAQNLSPEALEQVRLLTNLETSKQKLLQIVLLGQPELRELLQRRSLRQLAQRITARYHLTPLGAKDSASYVRHRLQVAGAIRNPFKESALKALYQRSHGVPRLINIIADRALVAAYAREKQDINSSLVHAAADEVQLGQPDAKRSRWPWVAATVTGLLVALVSWNMLRSRVVPAIEAESMPVKVIQATEPDIAPALPEPAPVVRPVPHSLEPDWLSVQNLSAWQGLANLWGDPQAGFALEAACNGSASTGWACLRENGSLARIAQLALPVVLQLQGDHPGLLLLQGISGDRLLVGVPGATLTVSRRSVEDQWLGSYLVAWPQAANWPREIARGNTGPAVTTVIQMAGKADLPYIGIPAFGLEFERWLVQFQQRYGLDSDGIVGPRTLLYLMRPSISQPALKSNWEVGE